jgi:hypothetical protein
VCEDLDPGDVPEDDEDAADDGDEDAELEPVACELFGPDTPGPVSAGC